MNIYAYPQPYSRWEIDLEDRGLTLRDYFAAKAMQATMHGLQWSPYGNGNPEIIPLLARDAYAVADEMLKAREA